MATQFTPGPWFGPNFNDTAEKATRALTGSFKPRGHKDAGDYILRVEISGENVVADARLITAAPKLHRALKDLLELVCVHGLEQCGDLPAHEFEAIVDGAIHDARRALAEASAEQVPA